MSSLGKRHPRRSRGTIAGLGVILVLAVSLTASAFAASGDTRSQASETGTGGKPTVVLVHGGWDNSTGWNAVVARLQERGFDVIAPANPLRDLASDSAYISSVLDTIEGPIVLVGHSYGGAVITNAAVGHDNVEALVYIAGFAPDEGESLFQLVTMNPGSELGPATLIPRPYPLPGGGVGTDLYITQEGFQNGLRGGRSSTHHRSHVRHAATVLRGSLREPLRGASVGVHPVLVPGREPGPSDPAGDATVHGRARRSAHHRGRGLARAAHFPARRCDPSHPASCAVRRVTTCCRARLRPGSARKSPRHSLESPVDGARPRRLSCTPGGTGWANKMTGAPGPGAGSKLGSLSLALMTSIVAAQAGARIPPLAGSSAHVSARLIGKRQRHGRDRYA